MAENLGHALEIQQHLVGLAEAIRNNGFDRSYLTQDGKGYALAMQGESAKGMDDFMKAVGQYLMKVQYGRGHKDEAKAELLRAFDVWLSKQKI